MKVFVDTSAILALASRTDEAHTQAVVAYGNLRASSAELITTSYIFLESVSLIQRRLGAQAAVAAGKLLSQAYTIIWVDASLHHSGWEAFHGDGRRLLSLVDCVSFAAMRRERLRFAFAFDRHFEEAGFEMAR